MTEPMYLISGSELDQIKNDCLYPERPSCDGCECVDGMNGTRASGLGCSFKGANLLMEEVIARGPVRQQAPAIGHYNLRHEKEFLIYDGELIAIKAFCERNGFEWRDDHIRNRDDLQRHDTALITQEREKWERERAQGLDGELVYYPISEGEIRSIIDMEHIPKDATIEQIFSANTKMLAKFLNRNPVIIRSSSSAEMMAARAREDVLIEEKVYKYRCSVCGKFTKQRQLHCPHCGSEGGLSGSYKHEDMVAWVKSLRSEVGK